MKNKYIIMNPDDNCATSLTEIHKEENIEINGSKTIKLNQDIPMGHKFALKNINKGDLIKKYGQIIGIATEDIKVGDWIHVHNIKSHYLERVAK
jgi:altronate dehydratase small subunit